MCRTCKYLWGQRNSTLGTRDIPNVQRYKKIQIENLWSNTMRNSLKLSQRERNLEKSVSFCRRKNRCWTEVSLTKKNLSFSWSDPKFSFEVQVDAFLSLKSTKTNISCHQSKCFNWKLTRKSEQCNPWNRFTASWTWAISLKYNISFHSSGQVVFVELHVLRWEDFGFKQSTWMLFCLLQNQYN